MVLDFSYQDIVDQSNYMVYLNVISYCMLSGCGNIDLPQDSELDKIYTLLKDVEDKKKPVNVFFMSSLYKRCMPTYSNIPENPFDFTGFQWTHKKMRKIIKADILSYSIFCLASLAKKINSNELSIENKDFIHFCLLTNAIKQVCFCRQYLKIGDLFYNGTDIGDNAYGEYYIEINPDEANIISQFQVLDSFSELLCHENLSSYCTNANIEGISLEFNILPLLCQNVVDNINTIKSRELVTIALCIINIYNNIDFHKETLYDAMNIIGCEIYERLYENGDIARNVIDRESSSFFTLCNCMNYLIRLYNANGLDMYKTAIYKLYDRIDSFWNDNMCLFIKINEKKVKYTIKDISCVISALKAFRGFIKEAELLKYVDKQLSSFYRSSIINSKIFNNQGYSILQSNKLELHNLGTLNKESAPLFSKEFEIKLNKKKYYCQSEILSPEYVLLGCKFLLS
jgi:hypothetical protein